MSIFRLLIALLLSSLSACGGSADTPVAGTPVTVQAGPSGNALDASESAVGDIGGLWHCAQTSLIDGKYLAYWNDAYTINFGEDRTLIRGSDENTSGVLWYTMQGVTIQWADGDISEYEANVACLLYTSPSPRDATLSRMPSSA